MPHFFLPIGWISTPLIIISALILTIALIYWATPNLNLSSTSTTPLTPSNSWQHVSEQS